MTAPQAEKTINSFINQHGINTVRPGFEQEVSEEASHMLNVKYYRLFSDPDSVPIRILLEDGKELLAVFMADGNMPAALRVYSAIAIDDDQKHEALQTAIKDGIQALIQKGGINYIQDAADAVVQFKVSAYELQEMLDELE